VSGGVNGRFVGDNLTISEGEWLHMLDDAAPKRGPFCLPNARRISKLKLLVEK
jgi:hypothetical protein